MQQSPAKQLIENIHTAMPAPDPSSFKTSSEGSSADNEKRSYRKQNVVRNRVSTPRRLCCTNLSLKAYSTI